MNNLRKNSASKQSASSAYFVEECESCGKIHSGMGEWLHLHHYARQHLSNLSLSSCPECSTPRQKANNCK
jgi:hypothetical protein